MSYPNSTKPFLSVPLFSSTVPLGMRFWDNVTNSIISDGLRVTAYPPSRPDLRVEAFTNHSGTYILRHLPGLRSLEQAIGDNVFWTTASATKRFSIEVVDITKEQRFLPFFFLADLPQKGLFKWKNGSEPISTDTNEESPIPLFSAPTRLNPGVMAIIRAELWDAATHKPAAWAKLEVSSIGQPVVRGYTDRQGRVALLFPYPQPTNLDFGAPAIPLTQQEWTLQLHASYTPQSPMPIIPNLATTLAQTPATLWLDAAGTQPCTAITVKFGLEATFPAVLWLTTAN